MPPRDLYILKPVQTVHYTVLLSSFEGEGWTQEIDKSVYNSIKNKKTALYSEIISTDSSIKTPAEKTFT